MATVSRVLPADIVQKLVLLSIFVLACSGAAALLDREPLLARLAAGVFYAWNPYVAERLIIGQWALLLGYAGLPWVLRAVLAPDLAPVRGAARLGLALLPAVVGGFAAMAITALVASPPRLLAPGARAGRAVGLAALAVGSLPWLIPSLLHPVYVDPAGVAAFAARADTPFGSSAACSCWAGLERADGPEGLRRSLVGPVAGARHRGRWPGTSCSRARQHRWPGLGMAAVAGLVLAALGVTAPGRDLLRSLIGAWPGVRHPARRPAVRRAAGPGRGRRLRPGRGGSPEPRARRPQNRAPGPRRHTRDRARRPRTCAPAPRRRDRARRL